MVDIKITGDDTVYPIENEELFDRFLVVKGVEFLYKQGTKNAVFAFSQLDDSTLVTYDLGPKKQQQQQQQNESDERGVKRPATDVDVTFVFFSELGAGKRWKNLKYGSDFYSDAKDFIISSWGLKATKDDLHLACYVEGAQGRLEITESNGYWRVTPSSNTVYFWVGAKDSPPRRMELLESSLERVTADVKRLKATSCTAKDQIERWNKKTDLSIECLEEAFPSVHPNAADADTKKLITTGPTGSKESHVQDMWNTAFSRLTTLWKDCRAPNGIQFDGRRHDIDLVLLTRDAISILYLDTSIELKDTIATDAKQREVVLQLLDRFAATFDGQPSREECWGLGMDGRSILFVKCTRNMEYCVSPRLYLTGTGWDLLLRFLRSSSEARGYVDMNPPILFGVTAISLLGKNVYLLDENTVCKVGQEEGQIKHEHEMLHTVMEYSPLLAPTVEANEAFDTSHDKFPYGFRMSHLQVPNVRTENDVVEVASHIFWYLGLLHKRHIVHRDVKPSNILYNAEGPMKYVLGDYAAALSWEAGQDMHVAATEAFSSLPGEFQNTGKCMYLCDLESLFWCIFAMWRQVLKKQEAPGKFRVSCQIDVSVLRDRGGAFVGAGEGILHVPHNRVLRSFLVQQAMKKTLFQPLLVFSELYDSGIEDDEFNKRAERAGMLPCPKCIFELLVRKQ